MELQSEITVLNGNKYSKLNLTGGISSVSVVNWQYLYLHIGVQGM